DAYFPVGVPLRRCAHLPNASGLIPAFKERDGGTPFSVAGIADAGFSERDPNIDRDNRLRHTTASVAGIADAGSKRRPGSPVPATTSDSPRPGSPIPATTPILATTEKHSSRPGPPIPATTEKHSPRPASPIPATTIKMRKHC